MLSRERVDERLVDQRGLPSRVNNSSDNEPTASPHSVSPALRLAPSNVVLSFDNLAPDLTREFRDRLAESFP